MADRFNNHDAGVSFGARRRRVEIYSATVTTTTTPNTVFSAAVTFDKAFQAAPDVINVHVESVTFGATVSKEAVTSVSGATVYLSGPTDSGVTAGDVRVDVVVLGDEDDPAI